MRRLLMGSCLVLSSVGAAAGCLPQAMACASPADPPVVAHDEKRSFNIGGVLFETESNAKSYRIVPSLMLDKDVKLSLRLHQKDASFRLKYTFK